MRSGSSVSLYLTMIDVGQGESFVIDFPDGTFALIDAGPISATSRVLAQVSKRVAAKRRFRWAAATQWDADHIGGFPAVLASHKPEEFVLPALDLGQYEELLAAVDPTSPARRAVTRLSESLLDSDITQTLAWARQEIPDCGVDVNGWFLSPDKGVKDELTSSIKSKTLSSERLRALGNRTSLVLIVSAYERSLFFPGEIEWDQYETVRVQFENRRRPTRATLRSQVVKLSHHGSERNNPVEFFQHFCADQAIGLASAGGRHGHPSPITIRDLRRVVDGQALCTGLGQPCNEIIHGRKPNDGEFNWASSTPWRNMVSPGKKCHGDVVVEVTARGHVRFATESVQPLCPFAKPPTPPRGASRARRRPV